jgi:hypothetical protein
MVTCQLTDTNARLLLQEPIDRSDRIVHLALIVLGQKSLVRQPKAFKEFEGINNNIMVGSVGVDKVKFVHLCRSNSITLVGAFPRIDASEMSLWESA